MSNFFEDVHNRESRKLFQKKALVDVHCHWLSKSLVKLVPIILGLLCIHRFYRLDSIGGRH